MRYIIGGWGRYNQELSSQLITLKNQIFPVKSLNLQASSSVSKSSVQSSVFTFKNWSIFQSSFFTKADLQTSQKPGYPPVVG